MRYISGSLVRLALLRVSPTPQRLRLRRRGCSLVERQPLEPLILQEGVQLDAEGNRAIHKMTELGVAHLSALQAPVCGNGDADGLGQLVLRHAPAHAGVREAGLGDRPWIVAGR